MQNIAQNHLPDNGGEMPQRQCPICGKTNNDWQRVCVHCGIELPNPEEATRAELGHLVYLLHRLTNWQSRGLVSIPQALQLAKETNERRQSLLNTWTPPAASPSTASDASRSPTPQAPPWVPPLPSQYASAMGVTPPAPLGVGASNVSSAGSSPPGKPLTPVPSGLRNYLQRYAIQTLFVLAAILVLTALRSMIAWEAVGAVAIKLVPLVPLLLTWMFWAFGQRTRQENPWAAFVYHALVAALTAFDLVAIHRYWLNGMVLSAKPMFCLAAGTATGVAVWMLLREKRVPYLHLALIGVLTSLFAGLQLVRQWILFADDFRVLPLPLFGLAYLLVAGLCIGRAHYLTRRSVSTQAAPADEATGNSISEQKGWIYAWTLWAHLSVLSLVLLCAVDIALQERVQIGEYALLTLLAAGLYGITAQILQEPRMVPVSGGLMLASGLMWLGEWRQFVETGFGDVLLAVGAIGSALSWYNGARSTGKTADLAKVWRRLAEGEVCAATLLVWIELLSRLGVHARGTATSETMHATVLCALCAAFLLGFARWERQSVFVFAALATGGAALVRGLIWADAPSFAFALTLTLYGSLLYGIALRFAALPASRDAAVFSYSEWGDAFRGCGFVAVLLALGERSLAFLTGSDPRHLALSLLPLLPALYLIAATRRTPGWDGMRILSLAAMQLTTALMVGAVCGLNRGAEHWTSASLQAWGCSLAALGWIWWGIGQGLDRRQNDLWCETLANGGLAIALGGGVIITEVACTAIPATAPTWFICQGVLALIFALFAWDAYRTQRELLGAALLLVTGMAGMITTVHAAEAPFVATIWTTFTLLSSLVFLLLARRMGKVMVARLSWIPAFGGYALMAVLQALHPLTGYDRSIADALWIVGGLGLASAWFMTTSWSESNEFSYAAALSLCGVYLRGVTLLWHPQLQWHALLMLPVLMTLYGGGTRYREKDNALFGQPMRRTALALSGLALLWSVGNGDGFLLTLRPASTWVVTLTLGLYGVAYALLVAYRRTPQIVGVAATTLTFAYIHHLLTMTSALEGASAQVTLSWPHFAFLVIQAGLFWMAVGWIVGIRPEREGLANPLLILAGGIALLSVLLAVVMSMYGSAESLWTILTLACGGVVWFGLWILELGEICLHVGTWNLLAAWMWLLYSRIGWETSLLDLYLLPVGLYLVSLGHRASHKQQAGARS